MNLELEMLLKSMEEISTSIIAINIQDSSMKNLENLKDLPKHMKMINGRLRLQLNGFHKKMP